MLVVSASCHRKRQNIIGRDKISSEEKRFIRVKSSSIITMDKIYTYVSATGAKLFELGARISKASFGFSSNSQNERCHKRLRLNNGEAASVNPNRRTRSQRETIVQIKMNVVAHNENGTKYCIKDAQGKMFTLDKFTLSDIDDNDVVNVLRDIGFTGNKLQESFTLTPLTSQSSANDTGVPAAPDTRICKCKRGNTSAASKLSIDGIQYLIGQTTMPGFQLTSEQNDEVKKAVTSISHSHRLSDQAYVAFPMSYCQDVLDEIKEIREQRLCKICMDNETCATFVPCGHLVSCMECYNKVQCCPVCKASIDCAIKTYIA